MRPAVLPPSDVFRTDDHVSPPLCLMLSHSCGDLCGSGMTVTLLLASPVPPWSSLHASLHVPIPHLGSQCDGGTLGRMQNHPRGRRAAYEGTRSILARARILQSPRYRDDETASPMQDLMALECRRQGQARFVRWTRSDGQTRSKGSCSRTRTALPPSSECWRAGECSRSLP